jgi:acetate kinase
MKPASNVLIFNCGSSSLSYRLYRVEPGGVLAQAAVGKAYHVAIPTTAQAYLLHQIGETSERQARPLPDHRSAAEAVLDFLESRSLAVDAIGHRFVHGGTRFQQAVLLEEDILAELEQLSALAPIHNPNSLSVVRLCQERWPQVPQFAAFDTAFHHSLPEHAWRYALPLDLADRYGYRKYGFHGLSYQSVAAQISAHLDAPPEALKMVLCHLGTGGASVSAVDRGRCVETSMGYSPLPGLMMSTRSGDLDPAIVLDLVEVQGYSPAEVSRLLNRSSGLAGIAGGSADFFEVLERAENGDGRAELALAMFLHRLRLYIGDYLAVLGGADVLAFTDDIGVRSWQVREWACGQMRWCGLILDPVANHEAPTDRLAEISALESRVVVLTVPGDEERVIAEAGLALL